MIPIEKPIIASIKSTLEGVDGIRKVIPYPLLENETISEYPAVVFFPDTFENSFDTVASNFEIRRFKLFLMMNANNLGTGAGQITQERLFTDTFPTYFDRIIAAFNEAWDGGVIDGHRVWYLINSGTRTIEQTDRGLVAYAEFTLDVKLSTNN